MNNKTFTMIIIAIFLGIAAYIFALLHGKYMDVVKDRLHDDCALCTTYRFHYSDDAAFAIREKRRKEKKGTTP